MTLSAYQELTTVRMAIEGFAAERAALHRTPSDLTLIRRYDAAFRHQCVTETRDTAVAMRANRDFHFAVYAAAGLPSLMKIISGLWLKIGPLLNFDMRFSPERLSLGGAEAHHGRCLEAIIARDGPAARAAMTGDIAGTAAFIATSGQLHD
nr:GntR family transcriptional regulator [Acuticoccus mangrovi]